MRYGLWTQPALSVRGSSRRIMSMRFRPAYISVINRRASSPAVIHSAVRKESSGLTSGNVFPSPPPIWIPGNAGTVLAVKGSLAPRQKKARPGPLRAVPGGLSRDGRLRREHSDRFMDSERNEELYLSKTTEYFGLDRVAPYQFAEGRSTCSITSTSTGPFSAFNSNPSCSRMAVKISGRLGSGAG